MYFTLLLAVIEQEPCLPSLALVTTRELLPDDERSLAVTSIKIGAETVVTESSTANTSAVIVTTTPAESQRLALLQAEYLNESVPVKPVIEVYLKRFSTIFTLP
mmetsp:Transcript_1953/g.3049  ORF Transcript_1953/g.3049 Transcript_1953/m.3049 type:complete len:104 (-) Transcript_1953:1407-1718(-)